MNGAALTDIAKAVSAVGDRIDTLTTALNTDPTRPLPAAADLHELAARIAGRAFNLDTLAEAADMDGIPMSKYLAGLLNSATNRPQLPVGPAREWIV